MMRKELFMQGVLAVAAASAVGIYRDAAGLIVSVYALAMLFLHVFSVVVEWLSWRGEPVIDEQRPAEKAAAAGAKDQEGHHEKLQRVERGLREAERELDLDEVDVSLESLSSDTRTIGRRVREIEDELN